MFYIFIPTNIYVYNNSKEKKEAINLRVGLEEGGKLMQFYFF